jgi:hypothetical protein
MVSCQLKHEKLVTQTTSFLLSTNERSEFSEETVCVRYDSEASRRISQQHNPKPYQWFNDLDTSSMITVNQVR